MKAKNYVQLILTAALWGSSFLMIKYSLYELSSFDIAIYRIILGTLLVNLLYRKKVNIKKTPLDLILCKKCKLVQLKHNYDLKYLYGPDYGYRTGINRTMREHVKNVMVAGGGVEPPTPGL